MKTIVLVLCLLGPLTAWAQKEPAADPQHLKMIKKGREAANEAKGLASGVQKSQGGGDSPQPDEPEGSRGGDKAAGEAGEQAE